MAYLAASAYIIQGILIFYGLYILLFVAAGVVKKKNRSGSTGSEPSKRFAVLVPARDEESSIAQVLDSLKSQTYPPELYDVFVVADNCTDNTAAVALGLGATTFERTDNVRASKGYALEFLFDRILEQDEEYDGFIILDADNVVHPSFLAEMNNALGIGCHVVQGQWRAKNYDENWMTRLNHASASLATLEQQGRLNMGLSCGLSGTGMAFSSEAVHRLGGWKTYSLLEDLEMQALCVSKGFRIEWWPQALTYDETTSSMRQASNQRLRWARGGFQVFQRYFNRLLVDGLKTLSFQKVEQYLWISRSLIPRSILVFFIFVFFLASLAGPIEQMVLPWQIWLIVMCGFVIGYLLGLITQKANWKVYVAMLIAPSFTAMWILVLGKNIFLRSLRWHKTPHSSTLTADELLRNRK